MGVNPTGTCALLTLTLAFDIFCDICHILGALLCDGYASVEGFECQALAVVLPATWLVVLVAVVAFFQPSAILLARVVASSVYLSIGQN